MAKTLNISKLRVGDKIQTDAGELWKVLDIEFSMKDSSLRSRVVLTLETYTLEDI